MRGMTHSVIGRLSLTSTPLADALAWVLPAVVVVMADSGRDWHTFGLRMLGLVAVATVLPVVLQRRNQPRLRESHARDVVEAVDDAAQVTAVACQWLRPLDDVAYAGSRAGFVRC
jgi:Kef-type K+ transport system membrane component KefB